jgi:ArsR family transcriptional regulator
VRSPLDEFRQSCLKEIGYLDIELPNLIKACEKDN